LENRGVDERIILKWFLEKWVGAAWIGSICKEQGHVAGFCECGN
jgi:hypothetical protein